MSGDKPDRGIAHSSMSDADKIGALDRACRDILSERETDLLVLTARRVNCVQIAHAGAAASSEHGQLHSTAPREAEVREDEPIPGPLLEIFPAAQQHHERCQEREPSGKSQSP
jgi:hypothetical protein